MSEELNVVYRKCTMIQEGQFPIISIAVFSNAREAKLHEIVIEDRC